VEINNDLPSPDLGGAVLRDSYDDFFRAERAKLACFVRKLGATWEEANDAAQEAMVAALVRWETLTNPRAWVRVVAERKFLRQKVRTDQREELAARPGWGVENSCPLPAESEGTQEVLSMIGRLPPAQRRVMAWTYDGYEPAEIAAVFGESAATVRSNLRHARQQIIAWLDARKEAEVPEGPRKEAQLPAGGTR
jgi:DNA-directed RNA polymerase specialized sigma24 family protein